MSHTALNIAVIGIGTSSVGIPPSAGISKGITPGSLADTERSQNMSGISAMPIVPSSVVSSVSTPSVISDGYVSVIGKLDISGVIDPAAIAKFMRAVSCATEIVLVPLVTCT